MPEFLHAATKVWSEQERGEFVDFIAAHPTAGVVVEGTGGVRKVRWGREGVGKRGGVRVIYYYLDEDVPLFLISIFAKSAKADVDAREKRDARAFVHSLKRRRQGARE